MCGGDPPPGGTKRFEDKTTAVRFAAGDKKGFAVAWPPEGLALARGHDDRRGLARLQSVHHRIPRKPQSESRGAVRQGRG